MFEFIVKEDGLYVKTSTGRVYKVIKAWESWNGWYWYALEDTGERYEGYPIWFGLVIGDFPEFGYFAEAELRECAPLIWEIKEKDLRHAIPSGIPFEETYGE